MKWARKTSRATEALRRDSTAPIGEGVTFMAIVHSENEVSDPLD